MNTNKQFWCLGNATVRLQEFVFKFYSSQIFAWIRDSCSSSDYLNFTSALSDSYSNHVDGVYQKNSSFNDETFVTMEEIHRKLYHYTIRNNTRPEVARPESSSRQFLPCPYVYRGWIGPSWLQIEVSGKITFSTLHPIVESLNSFFNEIMQYLSLETMPLFT